MTQRRESGRGSDTTARERLCERFEERERLCERFEERERERRGDD